MNKKIILIISVILIFGLLYAGYQAFLAPKGTEGSKEVTIQVVVEKEDIDETFTFKTDHEFLTDLIKEQQDKLGASYESTNIGTMITGLTEYKADPNSEYFMFEVNGEVSMVGTDDTPIQDGDTYKFTLTAF
ncbi:MAG: DUF4430 domain-containing protein [Caldicoprobacterales bacterium]|jgi:hypothetical protein|nr:DUF4430 domain-containing protein [Clostridiales bacterium]